MKRAAKIYTALIFVFLFAPIVILLVFSFNEAKSLSVFSGFSFKWYQELFRDGETLNALKNTLILAVVASLGVDRDGHGCRRGHEPDAQQISARRARHGNRHPHDESGHHHRAFR